MQFILATHNLHKIREFRDMFRGSNQIDLVSLSAFSSYELPEETGSTFEENAKLKAEHAAAHLQCWVIAEDSGLVVPVLQGRPGVYSKRYSGENGNDVKNRQKLLDELSGKKGLERSAYFECVIAVANPKGVQKVSRGTVEGMISEKEKGRNGFGYDSLFIKNDYEKTFAELDEPTKNKISHRRKAYDRLIHFLEGVQG